MTKENLDLKLYLGALKEPWSLYCQKLGKKPGAALREAIKEQLAKEGSLPSQPKTFRQTKESMTKEAKIRVEILLTPTEKSALEERAASERCSQRRWIVDAIRAGLTREPQFGMKEIETLGESNYQLLAIGRNLNQIAKAINEGRRSSVATDSIKELRKLIDDHTEKVSEAIRASSERWEIE